jgi:hypothetical protein
MGGKYPLDGTGEEANELMWTADWQSLVETRMLVAMRCAGEDRGVAVRSRSALVVERQAMGLIGLLSSAADATYIY